MAEEKSYGESQGASRRPRFCIVPERSLAVFNERSEEQIVRAQTQVNDELINALESMVKAARGGRIEGRAALSLEAVAW
ncbi:MAG TPA: hypothetical protein VGG03_08835 [Thermoanaerobaculia bacterium]|jgi:hypothetical protein